MPETLIFTTDNESFDGALAGDDVLVESWAGAPNGSFIQISERRGSVAAAFLTRDEALALADQLIALANETVK